MIASAIIGMIGGWLGGFLGRLVGMYKEGGAMGFVMSVVGAMVLILILRAVA